MCQKCGDPLTGSFHADHIKPFSKGGWTVTANGQALCAPCNLAKGNRYE
ncbi:MAG: HNH endonuclease signature motif containing protein [Pseudomonadota bacterium]